ncbi:uncharacterized protein LOC125485755 [Rhincodon typus]|uniref:uncharacterized protein LOC125485755 n=1 Tax=Rhincodon typus TaxID=259920 RepID=UPI00202DBD65|nr:uncharacterized protein LOC125485755 [Rhincodon typus]
MNWVGGVRNRIKLKQQKKQQKEFFEKRKLKTKFKLLDTPLSPQQNSSVSWDLLTLHIVNRIAAKKEQIDGPNKVNQVNMKKDTKMPIRQHNIELPMSPCSTPSRIFLEESKCSSQENEWSSRTKNFANMTNLKYGEQNFLSQLDMTPLTEPIEHAAVLTERIVSNCMGLPKHLNGRLLQNSVTKCSRLHSNRGEEHISFGVQDTLSSSQKVTTQSERTRQSMNFYGRDFPLTQYLNSESSQPMTNHVCQNNFMHDPLAQGENNFKINTASTRSNMCKTSVLGKKSVIQNRKNESIFTQPTANLFEEAVDKDNLENNSRDKHFLESNLEFNVQENNGFFRSFEESWRSLKDRGTVLNGSFESSQSPSYSPKETDSCCSVFSDLSELDGQIMQPDVSATCKGKVQEKLSNVQTVGENFEAENFPSQEYPRETNYASQSCSYPISQKVMSDSIESNVLITGQKDKLDQLVPSLVNYSTGICTSAQNTSDSKSLQVQNAWTQTEFSLMCVKRSDIAIQCNLSNATMCLSSPDKEPNSLSGDSSNHTMEDNTIHQLNTPIV